MPRLFGIDVSHYQSPTAPAGVSYADIAKQCGFVIVRATYGTWKDPSASAHVLRARDAGLQVGL
jgi:GH25 family lysozyme M1 (1,4-beta-N-acetylmuramidase)